MTIYDLLNRESSVNVRSFAMLGSLSALSNAMILAFINMASDNLAEHAGKHQGIYALMIFLLTVLIFGLVQRRLMVRASHHVEDAIYHMRNDLITRIRNCDLTTMEKIGRERIFNVMSKEFQTISTSSTLFVIVGQSSILLLFTSIYIAWLSLSAFFIILFSIAIGALIHLMRAKEVNQYLSNSFILENNLVLKITDFLDGFKEIKLSRPRGNALEQEFSQNSKTVTDARKHIQTLFSTDFVMSQISFYLATGAVVFVLPMVTEVEPALVTKITTATLFLIGPISSVIGGLPAYANANAAAKNVLDLDADLSDAEKENNTTLTTPVLTHFDEIRLEKLYFQYKEAEGEQAFEVGPISMNIKRGQTIFITGGNGSGKTTFIRLLTGLYQAKKGNIVVDGNVLSANKIDAYRNLFCAVFSDFHLFRKLYGIEPTDDINIQDWLIHMEMDHKVHLENQEFTTVDLSTGQRKRLALISCVLEQRPIFIFDEWAADQDPHFRQKFYREVLPRLKENGQTVIAITHDDKFFDMADVHLKMTDGQLIHINHSVEDNI
jgi:putative ATP-binding cassette transporter